jgi:hypothetical protein
MMNVKSIKEKQTKAGWGCAGSGAGRACDADSIDVGPVRAVGRFGTPRGAGVPESVSAQRLIVDEITEGRDELGGGAQVLPDVRLRL